MNKLDYNLKDYIIEATIDIGAHEGIGNVSNRIIAETCSVTSASIYYHFKNKYDLIWSAAEHVSTDLSDYIAKNNLVDLFAQNHYELTYKNSLKHIYLYFLNNRKRGMFYTRAFATSEYLFQKKEMGIIASNCPLCKMLKEGGEKKILKPLGSSIITLALNPLLMSLFSYFIKEQAPAEEEILCLIDSMWDAIKL